MKLAAILSLLTIMLLGATGTASGQQDCIFNIIGTWKASMTAGGESLLYRFESDGRVTVLSLSGSAEPREIASATYKLDDPKMPKAILFTAARKSRILGYGKSSMKIVRYDDASITCEIPGSGPTRWTRTDPNRYFIVLAARNGEFYDSSGSAFPMLIKIVGSGSQIDAAGTYSDHGTAAFGAVPPEAYKDFMREAHGDSEVILRLEINSGQYERGLKILQTWQRRARENALLYPNSFALNNVVLVKAVTETLNQCTEEVKLYKLNYIHPEDWISDNYGSQFIPFFYFRELRRLNESRHVRDDKFQEILPTIRVAQR